MFRNNKSRDQLKNKDGSLNVLGPHPFHLRTPLFMIASMCCTHLIIGCMRYRFRTGFGMAMVWRIITAATAALQMLRLRCDVAWPKRGDPRFDSVRAITYWFIIHILVAMAAFKFVTQPVRLWKRYPAPGSNRTIRVQTVVAHNWSFGNGMDWSGL